MHGTLIIAGIVIIALVAWWMIRNGKGKDDPPSQLKEINTWLKM